ncbi:replicative DNA helicase [bacterium]|nr:replicative DNA helicase [bacterium]
MSEPVPAHSSSPRPERQHPHNLDAERAVLGAVLLDNDVLGEISRFLKIEDFYQPGHQIIYTSMLELHNAGKPVELTMLADMLRREGKLDQVGNYVYLANLEQFVLSTSAAPEHARLVQEKSILRRLMSAADTILHESSEERREVLEQIEMAEKLIFEVSQETHSGRFQSVEKLMEDTIGEIMHLYETKQPKAGLPTYFKDLDKLIGGLEPSALAILAARPSIGKTALALNIVRNVAAVGNRPVAMFSLEMGAEQLNMRLLCSEARVPSHRVRKGQIKEREWETLRETASHMMDLPIYIDDTAAISIMQLRSRARRLKAQRPDLALIVVDYLQLMQGPERRGRDMNRQQEVSEISRGLKALAKELNVPVLALSQLSRNIESRSGKEKSARPMLSDLRESGAIEQDADIVMFVHRDRVEVQKDEDGRMPDKSLPIPTELIIGKNRNGPIGTVDVLFLADFTLFVDALRD